MQYDEGCGGRMVKKHVNAIYEKSGIHMRAAVVAWAGENGLVEPTGDV